MVSLSNHPALSGDSPFSPSFDKLRMSGAVNNPLMVSLSNHPALSGDSPFNPSFDKLRMSGAVNNPLMVSLSNHPYRSGFANNKSAGKFNRMAKHFLHHSNK